MRLIYLDLVTVPVQDFSLLVTAVGFAALVALLYVLIIHWEKPDHEHGFNRCQVTALGITLLVYVAVMVWGILPSAAGGPGSN